MQKQIKIICTVLGTLIIILSFRISCTASVENPVYSHKNEYKMIALTFDDGPHPGYTPQILDILKEYGIHATFFTVGENVRNYPEIVLRCVNEGHELANHTYSHNDMSKDSAPDIRRQILDTENALWECTEVRPKLFRPPGGTYGKSLISAAAELDYTIVLWNIDTRDWAHTSPKLIEKKVISSIRSGDIVLMHDYIGKNSPTPEALRLIIPKLQKKGYRFVTVSELLGCR